MNKIRALFDHSSGISALLNNTELSTQLLLDETHPDIESALQPSPHQRNVLELYSRELIYKLHVNRTKLLLTDLNNQRVKRVVVPYVNNSEKNWPLVVLNFNYAIICELLRLNHVETVPRKVIVGTLQRRRRRIARNKYRK